MAGQIRSESSQLTHQHPYPYHWDPSCRNIRSGLHVLCSYVMQAYPIVVHPRRRPSRQIVPSYGSLKRDCLVDRPTLLYCLQKASENGGSWLRHELTSNVGCNSHHPCRQRWSGEHVRRGGAPTHACSHTQVASQSSCTHAGITTT